ncbi:MAG TPA: hypothetical protein VJT49_31855 [Amycolatopsis sp.]|uniref:hypothetical protein n=1 Tax=Amycolatopsis sp. TaxID=37632 RepID=UPI002B45CBF6|nr:hypothetical protein [Amycolatopsis sp.]HKS49627.1 hypothetical protein [Amycolatopsis sp.]
MPTKSPRTQARRDEPTQEEEQRPTTEETRAAEHEGRRTATVNLPFVTAQFRAPRMRMPSMPVGRGEVAAAAQTARSYLPSARDTLYYGGLATLAAFEVIEWPVAAAIGVGTALMGRGRGEQREREAESGEKAREGASRR